MHWRAQSDPIRDMHVSRRPGLCAESRVLPGRGAGRLAWDALDCELANLSR